MDIPSSPTEKILIEVLLIKITLMGLDMRPLGKPKPGYEKRFSELFKIFSEKKNIQSLHSGANCLERNTLRRKN